MSKDKPIFGIFKNGIPYGRFGTGAKILLLLNGGPGNDIPTGMAFNFMKKGLSPFVEEYVIYVISRKSALPEGYTTRDMSVDYAELIRNEFGGKVDLIIGMSYGGLIAQHMAADFPDLFEHIVILMAAHKGSPEGNQLDVRFAELLSKGKNRSAYSLMAEVLYPRGIKQTFAKALLWLVSGIMKGNRTSTYANDVLIEARAEVNHDAENQLRRITVPVLILGGGRDFYFPEHFFKEMVSLIPRATLKIYPKHGHDLFEDPAFAHDVLNFVKSNPSRF